jgi:hypothetical protein
VHAACAGYDWSASGATNAAKQLSAGFCEPGDLGDGNSLFAISPIDRSEHNRLIAHEVLNLDRVASGWVSIVHHCQETPTLIGRCKVESVCGRYRMVPCAVRLAAAKGITSLLL